MASATATHGQRNRLSRVAIPTCSRPRNRRTIDAVGEDVTQWKPGQRVGVGWHGGHCFKCDPCRRGHFILCKFKKITGISYDGGYAEYVVVPAEAVAAIPDDLPPDQAAPLLCAGITVFNSMRNAGMRAGDTVAVQGIGGLGHLGVQYARQMGFRTIAIGRGADKEALAKKLGAHHYIDAETDAAALQKLGGANMVLATAPDSKAIASLVDGLGPDGKVIIVGAGTDPLTITPLQLIFTRKTVRGWPSGPPRIPRTLCSSVCFREFAHDRALSAGESRGRLRSNDQRTGSIPRSPDHEVTWARGSVGASVPLVRERQGRCGVPRSSRISQRAGTRKAAQGRAEQNRRRENRSASISRLAPKLSRISPSKDTDSSS